MFLTLNDIPNMYVDVIVEYLNFYKNSIVINSLKEAKTVDKIIFRDWSITATMQLEEIFKSIKKKTEYDDKITGKKETI